MKHWWRLAEVMQIKDLAQCLVQSEHSTDDIFSEE